MKRALFLPEGSELVGADERVLWQGRPRVAGLTARLFHVRGVALYFGAVAALNIASAYAEHLGAARAFVVTGWVAASALGLTLLAYAAAWCLAATTRYTVTDRRVILQIGVALPIALTLPLTRIVSADLRLYPDGTGDIPLTLDGGKLAYLLIWPHARPWRFAAPQPMLRAVPAAREAAAVLAQALVTALPQGEARPIAALPPGRAPRSAPVLAEA